MNKGQNKKGSGTYHYIFDTVKGSFASFARWFSSWGIIFLWSIYQRIPEGVNFLVLKLVGVLTKVRGVIRER